MTELQSKLLGVVRAFIDAHGFSPSYEEIRSSMGLSSKGEVYRMVHALALQGRVQVTPHRSRCIRVVDHGPSAEALAKAVCAELELAIPSKGTLPAVYICTEEELQDALRKALSPTSGVKTKESRPRVIKPVDEALP